jgi:hypothetical protein
MVLNATVINISVISWQSVLLVEETGEPGENPRPAASHWQTLSDNVVSSTSLLNTHLSSTWYDTKNVNDKYKKLSSDTIFSNLLSRLDARLFVKLYNLKLFSIY